jgi:hypothetical protein
MRDIEIQGVNFRFIFSLVTRSRFGSVVRGLSLSESRKIYFAKTVSPMSYEYSTPNLK